jgi:hypothetical protein
MGRVGAAISSPCDVPVVAAKINGVGVRVGIDTFCSVSLVTSSTARACGLRVESCGGQVRTVNGGSVSVVGRVSVDLWGYFR